MYDLDSWVAMTQAASEMTRVPDSLYHTSRQGGITRLAHVALRWMTTASMRQPSRVNLPSDTPRLAPVAPGTLVGYPATESCAIRANAIASLASPL